MEKVIKMAKLAYEISPVVFFFGLFMFVFETFIPLGNFMAEKFGVLGTLSGQMIGIWSLIGFYKILVIKGWDKPIAAKLELWFGERPETK